MELPEDDGAVARLAGCVDGCDLHEIAAARFTFFRPENRGFDPLPPKHDLLTFRWAGAHTVSNPPNKLE